MASTTTRFSYSLALLISAVHAAVATAQPAAAVSATRPAAEAGQYRFLLFYKDNDAATKAMAATLREALTARPGQAAVSYARVGDPATQELVDKYDVARAPMPLTVVIAPNGAITGVFAQKVTAAKITEAFVTPTMMFTMKSLQEGKLVLVSAQGSGDPVEPPAIGELAADPEFEGRVASISMQVSDPREARFTKQMKLDPRARGTSTVVIAPPGVLVGKFAANATKEHIATALAEAGKCCDDPNCERRR